MEFVKGFQCPRCGEYHAELPMTLGAEVPAPWYTIPQEEHATRCQRTSEQCVIDGKYFFMRGCLELPVLDGPQAFTWDVWVSVSEKDFYRASELWITEGRETESPYFGTLATVLPYEPETLLLKAMVHTREVGLRPWIELEPTEHPLAVEQHSGIQRARVIEIVSTVLHQSSLLTTYANLTVPSPDEG